MAAMADELIVGFPTHRSRSMRSVHFTDTAKLHIVPRLDDREGVHRNDLWYNGSDYSRMKLANQKSVLKVRAMASAGAPVSYSGDDGPSDDCLIGLEHLLTPATILGVMACRRRCVRAVLQEQARQRMNSDIFGWNNIAMASFDETRKAAVRARKLGKLHRDSI
ncbi:hypothetical protein QTG54_016725 [Skeletonema marinoi]|uniref:Uncharacterized protein n=1 Tax=Skeletonema marinoi TaxID=267567 RepID=A0AAD9D4D7_9STRA|nr:hypothetical protein QTG54_016725 [Skeletonema marinoi]